MPTGANVRKQNIISIEWSRQQQREDWQQHDDEYNNKDDFHAEADIHIGRLRQPNATDESVVEVSNNTLINDDSGQAKNEFSGDISLDSAARRLERHQSYDATAKQC